MAKDPAFLFYPGDWQIGTLHMTVLEKGAYMELLMLQFARGKFTLAHAKHMLNGSFDLVWATVKEKFKTDGEFFWNERLELEKEKRQKFTESRRINALVEKTGKKVEVKSKAYAKANANHMHGHMENENENIISSIILYFNTITNRVLTVTEPRKKLISTLLKDKFTEDDLKSVVKSQHQKWKDDLKMKEYITPETLFARTNFAKYLEASKESAITPAVAGRSNQIVGNNSNPYDALR